MLNNIILVPWTDFFWNEKLKYCNDVVTTVTEVLVWQLKFWKPFLHWEENNFIWKVIKSIFILYFNITWFDVAAISNTVKKTLEEACVQLLVPKRRIDILRDAMEAKQKSRPFVITFCGVNGVGKSTNLAKVTLHSMWSLQC